MAYPVTIAAAGLLVCFAFSLADLALIDERSIRISLKGDLASEMIDNSERLSAFLSSASSEVWFAAIEVMGVLRDPSFGTTHLYYKDMAKQNIGMLYSLDSGRNIANREECMVSAEFLAGSGLSLGSRLNVLGRSYQIVGTTDIEAYETEEGPNGSSLRRPCPLVVLSTRELANLAEYLETVSPPCVFWHNLQIIARNEGSLRLLQARALRQLPDALVETQTYDMSRLDARMDGYCLLVILTLLLGIGLETKQTLSVDVNAMTSTLATFLLFGIPVAVAAVSIPCFASPSGIFYGVAFMSLCLAGSLLERTLVRRAHSNL